MKQSQVKRFVSLILTLVLIACIYIPVGAEEPLKSGIPTQDVQNTPPTVVSDISIDKEDFFVTEEVAAYIAEFFVQDMVETGLSIWDSDTAIVNTVEMYDETGNNITGYTYELTSGYVVVAAYADMPNMILEWSDEADPVYKEFDSELPVTRSAGASSNSKVVYLGVLGYYLDEGQNTLKTEEGQEIPRAELSNDLESYRDVENVPEEAFQQILEAKQNALAEASITPFAEPDEPDNTLGGYITEPFDYAKNVYGGTWKNYEYANNWGSYANYAYKGGSYVFGYEEACGPLAITNLIKMYGNKYGDSYIKMASDRMIFTPVVEIGLNSKEKYYVNLEAIGGTTDDNANEYITKCFKNFGINIKTYGRYNADYQNIKNALSSSNRLAYIMLKVGHKPYGHHALVGYAYTRLYNSSKNAYKSFIKVCDGVAPNARYLDIYYTASSQFWEVYF